jgi:hypothetical protein
LEALLLVVCAVVLTAGCGEGKSGPISEEEIWSDEVTTDEATQPVEFAERGEDTSYGLPRTGEPGIAELIAIFNEELSSSVGYAFAESVFDRGDPPLQECRIGSARSTDRLPITVEGVVTYHPRKFFKVEVCSADEDERNWGAFTIEDDTGGVLVLRLGRTNNFSFGDRVRLTVYGVMLTFSQQADTRAVLSYDLEKISEDSPEQDEPVLFERTSDSFGSDDVTEVRRIEGYVAQPPTNRNFNEMLVADIPVPDANEPFPADPTRDQSDCVLGCENTCRGAGCNIGAICTETCESLCVNNGFVLPSDPEVPGACWSSNVDIDLGRRGFTVPEGAFIRATGPIVNNFSRQLLIYTPDQVEILSPPEE